MTKTLMNKFRYSLFWKSTYSWDNKILVSLSIDIDNFELMVVKIVVSLVWWSPRTTLRVNKVTMFKRFRCNLFKTNTKLEGTWWYSVGRATWKIINCSNWIYNWTVRKATWNNPNYLGMSHVSISQLLVSLVGTNIEKCDIQFVTSTFAPPYLWNNTVDTV